MLDTGLIRLNNEGTHAEVELTPNLHSPITASHLNELLARSAYRLYLPDPKAIEDAATKVNKLCGEEFGDESTWYTIAELRDATLDIQISPDKMSVEMTLTANWGGKDIRIEDVVAELKNQKIESGVKSQEIVSQLKLCANSQPGQELKSIIAEGTPAIDGKDAFLDRKVSLARERLLQPQTRDDGTVDMRDLGAIIMVKPNTLLLQKVPAEAGTAGVDVQGKVLPPKPGKDINILPGKGSEIDKRNPLQLRATVVGLPVECNNGLQVDNVLTIKDVDVSYGHVDFQGSIIITGDVHEDMHVKSWGDITVLGSVDSAQLEAEGDITISKGVIGRQLSDGTYAATLTAKGQINAQFVQYAELNAGSDITITKQLLHSKSTTAGLLNVGDDVSKKGTLVGGAVHTSKGVRSAIIGATSGTKTEIYCAMHEGEMRSNLAELSESLKVIMELDQSLAVRINRLPPKSEWQHDANMIAQIKSLLHEKARVNEQKKQQEQEITELESDLDKYYSTNHIDVSKCLFENIEFHIGNANALTSREYGPCKVVNQESKVTFNFDNN